VSRFGRGLVAIAVCALGLAGSGGARISDRLAPPAPPRGAALARIAQPPARAPLASERIYFVLTDRYENGDRGNDRAGLTGPRELTGFDPTDTGFFHGGDLAGLTGDCTGPRGLARIKDLGFTAIWVTPPFGQKYVQGDSAGYHGYWIRDFEHVDPHFGTDADFGAFVDCAHRIGLKVILDVVVNHTADVIQLPNYTYGAPKTPIVPAAERDAKRPAWLNDASNYHNRGNIDLGSCSDACFVLGDFFGLDDLATEKPAVRQGLVDIYADWIRRYKIDGFRIDTARHVEAAFFPYWAPRILAAAREAGVANFELFGEVAVTDAIELSAFVRDRGVPSVLDFPLQDALTRFAGGGAGGRGIADRFRDDDYFVTSGVAHAPPTFLGNHDMGRTAREVSEGGAGAGGPLLARTLLAYDLLYLLRGAPVVYYGDEFGIVGRGGDKEARHDLFPTQIAEWQTQERIGSPSIGTGSSFDVVNHPIAVRLRTLGALRAAHSVLSTGATAVRVASSKLLAVSRIDLAARREYLVLANSGGSTARVTVRTATPRSEWTRLLGSPPAFASSANGTVSISLAPYSSALLEATSPIPTRRPPKPKVAVAPDNLSDYVRVTATAGTAPVTIGFAIRRAGATWTRVAADDSPPYRTFLDPRRFRRREIVNVVAVARGLGGSTAVSAVRSFVPRR
jgi:alpha-amylase